jgi:hypothetical protein
MNATRRQYVTFRARSVLPSRTRRVGATALPCLAALTRLGQTKTPLGETG